MGLPVTLYHYDEVVSKTEEEEETGNEDVMDVDSHVRVSDNQYSSEPSYQSPYITIRQHIIIRPDLWVYYVTSKPFSQQILHIKSHVHMQPRSSMVFSIL